MLALVLLGLTGCGTIMDLGGSGGEPPARIYGGVRTDADIVFVGRCKLDALAPCFLFDLPFSAAFDTALLSITLTQTLFGNERGRVARGP